MSNVKSDAFVFFGATGDLACKKIFPALQAMAKRGHLDVPVIGVAKAGWGLDQFRARARDSVEQHGGLDARAFDTLCGLLRYVDGDYRDPATFQGIRSEEHTSELQSPCNLVCRLLLEKKKKKPIYLLFIKKKKKKKKSTL